MKLLADVRKVLCVVCVYRLKLYFICSIFIKRADFTHVYVVGWLEREDFFYFNNNLEQGAIGG
jgi:hypothetical protein